MKKFYKCARFHNTWMICLFYFVVVWKECWYIFFFGLHRIEIATYYQWHMKLIFQDIIRWTNYYERKFSESFLKPFLRVL